MHIKKRFIAGAKCTKCQALDRVALMTTANDEWIECVDCAYVERRPTADSLQQHVDPHLVSTVKFFTAKSVSK